MLTEIAAPTVIAEGTKIRGTLTFQSTAELFGLVEGEVLQQSLEVIQIGKTGWINGSITSQGPVLVEGRVDGDITSSTAIRLLPTAQVKGRLIAPAIEVKAGAIFEGAFVMKTTKARSDLIRQAA